jgi:purine-binding chemotaxis protein CheW
LKSNQYSTFKVQDHWYGVDVQIVQEVTKALDITRVPLAPHSILGLINLRGQIATAVGLRELFETGDSPLNGTYNNVICNCENLLVALVVDEIGDVLELDSEQFTTVPETVAPHVRQFLTGVYKLSDSLISVLDIKKIVEHLNS